MNKIEAYARTTAAVSGYSCPPAGFYAHGWTERIKAAARQLLDVSLRKYLRVFPIETQEIVWVRREDEVIYTIESNTQWNIV